MSDDLIENPQPAGSKLTEQQLARLEGMSMIGRTVTFGHKGGGGSWTVGVVVEEVYIIVGDYKHLIQRIRLAPDVGWDESDFAYRTAYYTYSADMTAIKWGQYTQFLTEMEYTALLKKAKEKGWPIL